MAFFIYLGDKQEKKLASSLDQYYEEWLERRIDLKDFEQVTPYSS